MSSNKRGGGGRGGGGQSGTKGQLKAIADAVKSKDFDAVVEKSQTLLQSEPKHYQAHVLLAFAYDKLNQPDEAEKTYKTASELLPTDPQAWQGLIKIYEKQWGKKLPEYQAAILKLGQIHAEAGDVAKCQEVVDKFVDFVRAKGERPQYAEALQLYLPDCPLYDILEGRVPHPAKTYETVAQITETADKKKVNTLIGERRTRIGARLSEVTLEVKREVYKTSKLDHYYRQLINWTSDDEARRMYEEKLLQYCYERVLVFKGDDKAQELEIVRKLAQDMVIIKHPFKLAWDITIDWQEHAEIKDWDIHVLTGYCSFFPDSDLYKVITGFLTSAISPFPKQEQEKASAPSAAEADGDDSDDDEGGGAPTSVVPLTEEDRLLMMADGVSGANSLFGYRLMAAYYEHFEEYESNVDLMRKAMDYLADQRRKTGLKFSTTEDVFTVFLATALVFYQSPRNHQEAKALFDRVLEHDPSSTAAMIGVGLIFEEEEEFDEAITFLERALKRDNSNLRVRTEAAWVYSLKGEHQKAKDELEQCIPLIQAKGPTMQELLAQSEYRLGVCMWKLDTSKAGRKDRTKAYAQWLNALKHNLNLAPAYTSLGVYYADYARDKKRAKRCFQKAVELSSSEVESAERLARTFADDGDWDRVELIAQRVVDSGKVKPPPGSKRKGISWPYAALGVAQLNKQDFTKAIISFQAATRISPDDYHSLVGLGESYHSSGKHLSAIKAIHEAQRLEAEAGADRIGDTWFTKFLLANVNRELAMFDDAISLYQEVISGRPDEEGVAIALMQTMVESALTSVESGYYGKAVKLATDTLEFATKAPKSLTDTFNYWKAVGDACSVFSSVQGRVTEFPTDFVREVIGNVDDIPEYELLRDVDNVHIGVISAKGLFPDDEKVGVEITRCMHATILAHKRAVHVSAHDIHAQAVAYYNLGWAEHRAHSCLPESMKKSSRYLKAAMRCFKRSIELEAGNAVFWNALGVVTSRVNPAIAQHSFVRSLHLNERNAHVWSNLGTLALLQNDIDMANKAFTNAQSNDPDCSHGWLGQGFVALLLGKIKEARGLFTHAMELSEASSLISRQQYSVSVFDHIVSSAPSSSVIDLVLPVFALSQLRRMQPQDTQFGHLYTLFQERIYDSENSAPILEEICSTLEAEYEVTESPQALKRFALAKTDLARAYLAVGKFEAAVECGEMALQLSSDESDNELSPDERRKARLSAHLTLGLAQYHNEKFSEAVTYFETALSESENNPDAVCLLAQILWAKGTPDAREKARNALFDVIGEHPDHVQAVLLLGVIALLDSDEESLDAVLAELKGMQVSDSVTAIEQEQIGEVLQAIAISTGESSGDKIVAVAQTQTDIMLHPHLPHGWSSLAEMVEDENGRPAEMALQVALKAIPPRGRLGAEDLARVYAGTRTLAGAQSAAMVAPYVKDGWEGLADAVGI